MDATQEVHLANVTLLAAAVLVQLFLESFLVDMGSPIDGRLLDGIEFDSFALFGFLFQSLLLCDDIGSGGSAQSLTVWWQTSDFASRVGFEFGGTT